MRPVRLRWILSFVTAWTFQPMVQVPALAQKTSTNAGQPIHQVSPAVTAQYERIQRLLPAATMRKVHALVPDFRKKVIKSAPGTDFKALATSEVRKHFPQMSPQQNQVAAFTLLNQTNDSLSDMSQMSEVNLQNAAQVKSQFESIFSNMLKAMEQTQDSVIKNMKS